MVFLSSFFSHILCLVCTANRILLASKPSARGDQKACRKEIRIWISLPFPWLWSLYDCIVCSFFLLGVPGPLHIFCSPWFWWHCLFPLARSGWELLPAIASLLMSQFLSLVLLVLLTNRSLTYASTKIFWTIGVGSSFQLNTWLTQIKKRMFKVEKHNSK